MSKKTMKALVLEKAYQLRIKEVPIPEVPNGYALIKVLAVSVCGSDIHAYKGNSLLLTYPRVLGHEICGIVEKINGFCSNIKESDKVCIIPYLSCGHCLACRKGRENCCTGLKVLGVHVDGGMADYISVPIENLIKVSMDMDPKLAALTEPLAVSAHAVRRGNVKAGDKVLILGAGPIGIGVAEFSRIKGADVITADINPVRRAIAEKYFSYRTLDPTDVNFEKQIKIWTNGDYPEKVFDSTGNKASNSVAINYLAATGDLIFVGLQTDTLGVSDPAFHIREATIYASRVAQKCDFEFVLQNVISKRIKIREMITDVSNLGQSKEAFENWASRNGKVFKGIIEMK